MNTRLMPRTEFLVYNKISLSDYDRRILSDVYMPLIGPVALSIYNYLIDMKTNMEERFHSEFMDVLNIELSTFSSEIEKLEAIDLIRTYVNDEAYKDQFLYEVKTPLDAEMFFNDPMLSMFLFAKIGSKRFNEKKESWLYHKFPDGFTDISRNFAEVFTSLRVNEFQKPTETFVSKNESVGARVDVRDFDFDVLFTHLRGTYVEKGFFNTEVQKTIAKLAQMFNLSVYQMKDIVIKSTDQRDGIDIDLLKHYALREYSAVEGPVEEKEESSVDKIENDEDYFVKLDSISPLNRIEHLRKNHASRNDLRIVTELIMTTKLTDGVINVLLEYVIQKNPSYINENYIFSIARDWENKGYVTAKEAADAVISFQNKNANKKPYNNRFKVSQKAVEPKWFSEKRKEQGTASKKSEKNEVKDDSIEARIREFRNNR